MKLMRKTVGTQECVIGLLDGFVGQFFRAWTRCAAARGVVLHHDLSAFFVSASGFAPVPGDGRVAIPFAGGNISESVESAHDKRDVLREAEVSKMFVPVFLFGLEDVVGDCLLGFKVGILQILSVRVFPPSLPGLVAIGNYGIQRRVPPAFCTSPSLPSG